jgi:hypothetical protein
MRGEKKRIDLTKTKSKRREREEETAREEEIRREKGRETRIEGMIEETKELEREEKAEGETGLWSLSARRALLREEAK